MRFKNINIIVITIISFFAVWAQAGQLTSGKYKTSTAGLCDLDVTVSSSGNTIFAQALGSCSDYSLHEYEKETGTKYSETTDKVTIKAGDSYEGLILEEGDILYSKGYISVLNERSFLGEAKILQYRNGKLIETLSIQKVIFKLY